MLIVEHKLWFRCDSGAEGSEGQIRPLNICRSSRADEKSRLRPSVSPIEVWNSGSSRYKFSYVSILPCFFDYVTRLYEKNMLRMM